MNFLDRRSALRASFLCALGSGTPSVFAQQTNDGSVRLPIDDSERTGIRAHEPRYAGGAKGNGTTDDTLALTAAIEAAVSQGRALYLDGTYAVARLKLPGLGRTLRIIGNPVFIQAYPNVPCLAIADRPLQQSVGCELHCGVVPHSSSSKLNPANIAVDLTGFSASDVVITLGEAKTHTPTTGRFHTVVHADAASPFHYGNHIRLIASAVPAPRYGIRYTNRGSGVKGNPNVNMVSGWFSALDTNDEDVLIDVGDTTQTIVTGPTLMEACPGATGVKAGNFTTLRDIWFERIGVSATFVATKDTVPNNCRVERCQFSGTDHRIVIDSDLGAPPTFVECLEDTKVSYLDQHGVLYERGLVTHSFKQPKLPSMVFTHGVSTASLRSSSVRMRVDHHGRTTYQMLYIVMVSEIGRTTMRLVIPEYWEVEHAVIGVRDSAGNQLSWGLGDDDSGRDYNWAWTERGEHSVNIRVTISPSILI